LSLLGPVETTSMAIWTVTTQTVAASGSWGTDYPYGCYIRDYLPNQQLYFNQNGNMYNDRAEEPCTTYW
jgi:hypothetical protein